MLSLKLRKNESRTSYIRYGGGIVSAGQNTQHSVLSVCSEHRAMLKSIAVNVRKPKGKILKIFKVYVNIER